MVAEKYGVRLPSEDRDHLERLIRSGQRSTPTSSARSTKPRAEQCEGPGITQAFALRPR